MPESGEGGEGPLDDIGGVHHGMQVAAEAAWRELGSAGAWWAGAQRLAIAEVARASAPRPLWDRPPRLDALPVERGDRALSPFVCALTERVAVEPSSITSELAAMIVDRIGDAAYAELCSVVCQVVAIDHFRAALGVAPAPFPDPQSGEPSRVRPHGMADVGGHIEMTERHLGPNIGRSLSLAGDDHTRWFTLVFAMYAGEGFAEMVWDHRALARPQVELIAARTSALNECFY